LRNDKNVTTFTNYVDLMPGKHETLLHSTITTVSEVLWVNIQAMAVIIVAPLVPLILLVLVFVGWNWEWLSRNRSEDRRPDGSSDVQSRGWQSFLFFWIHWLDWLGKIDFPKGWRLFSYVLPRPLREKVFEPAYNDLVQDFVLTRRKYRNKWVKRWLGLCYTFRTMLMVADCCRVGSLGKIVDLIAKLIPSPLMRWWRS
jgi:hypothetical protein